MNLLLLLFFFIITIIVFSCNFEEFKNSNYTPQAKNYNNLLLKQAINQMNFESKSYILSEPDEILNYRPGTFNEKLLLKIHSILNPIINKINKLTNTKQILLNIDNVNTSKYNNNNTEKITVDFFVYDIKNYVQTRLICTIIFIDNKYNLNNINLSNSNYIENKQKNESIRPDIDSSLIIKDSNFLKNDVKYDISKTTLENSMLKYGTKNNGILEKNMHSWIQPIEAEKIEKSNKPIFPARKVKTEWNVKGIQPIESSIPVGIWDKFGINSSDNSRKVIASFNPTVTGLPRDNFGLHSLFDLSIGIPSFPHS